MRGRVFLVSCLLSVAVTAACGGSSSSPLRSPTGTPIVQSAQQAIDIAMESLRPLYESAPNAVSAVHMTAAEAARETKDLGLEAIPLLQAPDYKPCGASSCPNPGEPADEPGYLVPVTATPLLNAAPVPNSAYYVAASWVGDDSGLTGAPPTLPSPAPQDDGSFLAIKPTDWVIPSHATIDESATDFQISVAVGGGCDQFDRIDTSETSDTVSIRAFYRETTYPDTACTLQLIVQNMNVHLNAPLGDRKLEGCDGSPISYLSEPPLGGDCRMSGP